MKGQGAAGLGERFHGTGLEACTVCAAAKCTSVVLMHPSKIGQPCRAWQQGKAWKTEGGLWQPREGRLLSG